MPVVGFLGSASEATSGHFVKAFIQSLRDGGFVENRNVRVEYRWADNQYNRLPALASTLRTIAADGPDSAYSRTLAERAAGYLSAAGSPLRPEDFAAHRSTWTKPVSIDYRGFTIADRFVIGYGLDYDERYRNLPYIGVLRPSVYGASPPEG